MKPLFEDHKKLIIDLQRSGVEFILVGGYAVNVHGYNRTTQDMDLWIMPDNNNRDKLIAVLGSYGFHPDDLKYLAKQDFREHFAFHYGEAPLRVDFITRLCGVNYNEADEQKIMLPLGDVTVPVIQLHHLVLSKTGTGRLQDAADIESLQKIAEKRKKS